MPIDVTTLQTWLNAPEGRWPRRDWALFDVREVGESQQGHIPGATFLPRRMLEFRLPEILPAHAVKTVLYDSGTPDDRRAQLARDTMLAHGYHDVTWLDGGLAAWRDGGGPAATGWNVPCKDFGEQVAKSGDAPVIQAGQLADDIGQGKRITVVDVRTSGEYRHGSLPGSVSSPSFEWSLAAIDLAKEADALVLHCAGRTRSIIGVATARLLGISNAWALEDGTMGWELSDRALARAQTATLGPPSISALETARQRAMTLAKDAGASLISCEALERRMAETGDLPLYLFDAREEASFVAGHIPGALSLPGGQACQRADDFAAVPGAPLVFVDDGDARALLTAYWFSRMGFPDISVLDGGLPAWESSGRPVETGRVRPAALGIAEAKAHVPALDGPGLAAALASPNPPIVLDVGSSKHVKAGHIAGAAWIPRGYLEMRGDTLVSAGRQVVVASHDPAQAALAAATLQRMGVQDVARLSTPGQDWNKFLPLATGLPDGAEEVADTLAIPYRQDRAAMRAYLEWEKKLGESGTTTAEAE